MQHVRLSPEPDGKLRLLAPFLLLALAVGCGRILALFRVGPPFANTGEECLCLLFGNLLRELVLQCLIIRLFEPSLATFSKFVINLMRARA